MFMNEEDIVFEAGVEMWLETEVHDNRIMMTVDVCVDAVQAFEDLSNQGRKSLWERHAYRFRMSLRNSSMFKVSPRRSRHAPILLGNICSLSMLL